MRAVLSHPATETAAALLADQWCIALKWGSDIFYLGPFDDEYEMRQAEHLLTEPAEGHA